MATQKIKIYRPHIDCTVMVSDQMSVDYEKCTYRTKRPQICPVLCDCGKCSWKDVTIGNTPICTLPEMRELLVIGGK